MHIFHWFEIEFHVQLYIRGLRFSSKLIGIVRAHEFLIFSAMTIPCLLLFINLKKKLELCRNRGNTKTVNHSHYSK